MADFLTDWANLLPSLVPSDLLGHMFPPTRVDRHAKRRLEICRAIGEYIVPASLHGVSEYVPLPGYVRVGCGTVEFSLDEQGQIRHTTIEPNQTFGRRVKWGDFTGKTVWAAQSMMRFIWEDSEQALSPPVALHVPPVWTEVLAAGLEQTGFRVAGTWPPT
jgi:hypothetical protein